MTTCPKFSGRFFKIWRRYLKNCWKINVENPENTFWDSLKKTLTSLTEHRCGPRFLGRCNIKQVGHHGWPTKKILRSRSSKTCLNYILCSFSLWSALCGFSVAACVMHVMHATHNITKANVKTEFQKSINSWKHQVSNKFMTITSVWEKKI